jgi:hypothetical protein
MSLSQEQQSELKRLNEVFKKFEASTHSDIYYSEETVEQFARGEIQPILADRLHLDKLAEARKKLLKKGNSSTVVQKISEDGSIQLSFE